MGHRACRDVSTATLSEGRSGRDEVIASHIRIPVGGDVPDYVHYHKVRFRSSIASRAGLGWFMKTKVSRSSSKPVIACCNRLRFAIACWKPPPDSKS